MKHKIDDLRDYAELAWASYGYWHLIGKKFANKTEYKDRKNTEITMSDILDVAYNGYVSSEHITFINTEKLDGEMAPLQIQAFIKRYKIYFHQPNTVSGFSATLFYDTQKDRFVLGFRGTEGFWNIDAIHLSMNIQHSALLDFLKEVKQIL